MAELIEKYEARLKQMQADLGEVQMAYNKMRHTKESTEVRAQSVGPSLLTALGATCGIPSPPCFPWSHVWHTLLTLLPLVPRGRSS